MCIGSPRATFDSFGPLVGSKLTEIINNPNIKIYGTMENPLNAKNIELFLSEHSKEIDDCLTLVIDASFAKICSLRTIVISNEGIYPGSGVGKNLPYIGNLSIKGITIGHKTSDENSHTIQIDLNHHLFKKTSSKENAFDLYYSSFCDVLNSKDIVSMVNIVSNALTTSLERILDSEKEKIETCKKLSFKL